MDPNGLHYRDAVVAARPNRCALPTKDASFRLAQASNTRATATKRQFVAAFNPLAQRFTAGPWSPAEI